MTQATHAALLALHAHLDAEGGLLAAALRAEGPVVVADDPNLGALAASGPACAAHPEAIAFAVEAAREGHLLHGGASRVLEIDDLDLAILAGDRLYALGLAGLAEIGAIDAVRELADVIALCAQARATPSPELAEAVWLAGATAIGWGGSAGHEVAKSQARAGDSRAVELLRAAARDRAGAAAATA